MVHGARVHLVTPRRLDTDEGQAEAQTGDHHAAVAAHWIVLWSAPTFQHGLAIGLGQSSNNAWYSSSAQALLARAQVKAVEVVGDTAEQLLDQCGAAVRQRAGATG